MAPCPQFLADCHSQELGQQGVVQVKGWKWLLQIAGERAGRRDGTGYSSAHRCPLGARPGQLLAQGWGWP